jgi:hydrogenase/urease accessory protein HupE
MSDLATFVELGFHHIVNPDALDHILFLLALAAVYRREDWRDALWVVTAFTVGHSITLAVTGALVLPTPLIEFLIPVTIVATALENIAVRTRAVTPWNGRYRALFTAVFGLVHGAGFANYLRTLFDGPIVVPLVGFNLGIEVGQILVLSLAALLLAGIDRLLSLRRGELLTAYRWRVVSVSAAVLLVASRMAMERRPW